MGKQCRQWQTIFGGSKIAAGGDYSHEIKRHLHLGRKVLIKLDSISKSRNITLPTNGCIVKAMVFPIVMYGCELDCKESWVPKNWCFWIVVLEETLESPLDCKESQPLLPKGNQFWIFIGRTDAEAEAPLLWPPDGKNWLICKDPDAGKDWRWKGKGPTKDEMVGWHLMGPTQWIWVSVSSGMDREDWCTAVHGVTNRHNWATELNWVPQWASSTWIFLNFLSHNS